MEKPHIVKFSGGRSSGMMLINLLEQGVLDSKRGDVIVFNNTSAEHPATYEFTRKMKTLAEEKYNIPFFWVEFQTYEDASRDHYWVRKPTYKLVNQNPYSKSNPHGYKYKGEIFEEVLSYTGYLPNRISRICTAYMKIFTTNSFLSDWFAQKQKIQRLGHYGEKARMSEQDVFDLHRKNRGETPKDILLVKRAFMLNCPFVREAQNWQDFTNANICINNPELKKYVINNKAQLYGEKSINYISYLGIRCDEEKRLIKFNNRIDEANEKIADSSSKSFLNQPPGEDVLAPMVDNNISQEDVVNFWQNQSFDLELPYTGDLSNCVYCPLKSKSKLISIVKQEMQYNHSYDIKDTPASIEWWIDIERRYSRNLIAEERNRTSEKVKFVGFFGAVEKIVFEDIKSKAQSDFTLNLDESDFEDSISCNCTD